jgi:hypothetical protein
MLACWSIIDSRIHHAQSTLLHTTYSHFLNANINLSSFFSSTRMPSYVDSSSQRRLQTPVIIHQSQDPRSSRDSSASSRTSFDRRDARASTAAYYHSNGNSTGYRSGTVSKRVDEVKLRVPDDRRSSVIQTSIQMTNLFAARHYIATFKRGNVLVVDHRLARYDSAEPRVVQALSTEYNSKQKPHEYRRY